MVLHSSSAGRDARRNLLASIYTPRPEKGDQPPSLLDRDHRDRRIPGRDRDQLLRHQVLEPPPERPPGAHPEGAPMTELIRSDAPRRSSMGALAIGGLIIGIIWFSILTVILSIQDLNGFADSQTDSYMAVFMGMGFLLFAVAIDVYRKEFMPDELIHKICRPEISLTRPFR